MSESILYIGLSQSIFAAFVLGTRQKVFVADKILIICLLTIAFRFSLKLLSVERILPGAPDISIGIIPLTFGPFLYLYTKYLINNSGQFSRKDLWHFLPVFLFLAVGILLGNETLNFNEVTYFEKDSQLWLRIIFGLFFFTSVLVYSVFTFIQLNAYRRSLKPPINYNEGGMKLIWLNLITLIFVSLFLSYLVFGGINALTFSERFDINLISNIGITTIVFAISYFGLSQPSIIEVFYNRALKMQQNDDNHNHDSELHDNDLLKETASHLLQFMREEKPYLKPDLSMAYLATRLGVPKSLLTKVLNNYLGKNFFHFVNEYRLQEVLEKLKDPDLAHYTILSLAYDSGFNSKSTFNSIFKQYTGLTPTAYKNKLTKKGSRIYSDVQ